MREATVNEISLNLVRIPTDLDEILMNLTQISTDLNEISPNPIAFEIATEREEENGNY